MFWRAAVLWKNKKRMVLLPFILLVLTAVSDVTLIGCYVGSGDNRLRKCDPIRVLTWVLTIGTNIATVGSLGYYAWLHRQAVRGYLSTHHSKPERILVIIVEGGIVYTINLVLLGVVTIVAEYEATTTKSFGWFCASSILEVISFCLQDMYPALLLVIIFMGRSIWDSDGEILTQERTSNERGPSIGSG
ncbi:hypothetical protein VNI00_018262 [Paramarasmius palmivorus]|uniref:Uncharacterized protein n=1 Tax=Paramarasmius palmivorus TaxID=297713 RepID=A0AAW0AYQ7_9AGAR